MTDHEVLIVTGMSGAGRSTAAHALEDHGWYVVDNMPPQLLGTLIDLAMAPDTDIPRVACVVDVRGGRLFEHARDALLELSDLANVRVLFLDATDDVLVRRFEQVRRPHPLQGSGTLLDGIEAERSLMQEIRERSDVVVDTSELTIHQLTTIVSEQFAGADVPGVSVTLMSFGYKYGLPTDVDMVWDMRFIENPFWSPELRSKTGLDPEVQDFVADRDGYSAFLDLQVPALRVVLEGYRSENKRFVTLAIGCTGGKHRSVATVEAVARQLAGDPTLRVSVKHRDVGRE